jgi:hypothetical protein
MFRKLYQFPSSGDVFETFTLLCPLERVRCMRLALSNGPISVDVSHPHVRMETDPVSEMLLFFAFFRIQDYGQSPNPQRLQVFLFLRLIPFVWFSSPSLSLLTSPSHFHWANYRDNSIIIRLTVSHVHLVAKHSNRKNKVTRRRTRKHEAMKLESFYFICQREAWWNELERIHLQFASSCFLTLD